MFFFIALYLQNIKGYSPLQAGVRFLPSTLVIMVIGPVAGRLSDRIGPRPLIVGGLLAVSGSLFWQSYLAVDSSYLFMLPGFILMGVGMGFVMSPMSTAAMNAVDATKAGVASGTLSMSRMVGGTFGVAALGALMTAVGRAKIDNLLPALPTPVRHRLAEGLGSGGAGPNGSSGQVGDALREAFVSALGAGLRIGAVVALVGVVVAIATIGGKVRAASPTSGDALADAFAAEEPASAAELVKA
jgi:MFS family permease